MQVSRRFFTAVAASTIASAGLGCVSGPSNDLFSKKPTSKEGSFLDSIPFVGKKDKTPEPYTNPVKLAVTWTPDTIIQTGRTPTRGFGGRIFFYDEKSKSVPVEGTLVVHGFDDTSENDASPAKRFEFTPEQFTRHFSQGDLGASYSIWIPWDAIGGEKKTNFIGNVIQINLWQANSGYPCIVDVTGNLTGRDGRRQTRTHVTSIPAVCAGFEHWRNTKNRPDDDDDSPPR